MALITIRTPEAPSEEANAFVDTAHVGAYRRGKGNNLILLVDGVEVESVEPGWDELPQILKQAIYLGLK